ncbi:Acyltransferase [Phytophthora megakarya]|uniref:Acyltransferase n=1 Tax=Phytophthora megakarya TaxID=4795 RepID=A0A225WNG0_9STRA|nr:Acyltransferase [Phytophthora megakarya]
MHSSLILKLAGDAYIHAPTLGIATVGAAPLFMCIVHEDWTLVRNSHTPIKKAGFTCRLWHTVLLRAVEGLIIECAVPRTLFDWVMANTAPPPPGFLVINVRVAAILVFEITQPSCVPAMFEWNGPLILSTGLNGGSFIREYKLSDLHSDDFKAGVAASVPFLKEFHFDYSVFGEGVTLYKEDAVMNGIAYTPVTRHVFVTGKLWDSMFQLKLLYLDSH